MSPGKGGVLYLRLLLHHKAARSFEELRTHDDIIYETFQDAAPAMGIIKHDDEYKICLEEAVIFNTGRQLLHQLLSH